MSIRMRWGLAALLTIVLLGWAFGRSEAPHAGKANNAATKSETAGAGSEVASQAPPVDAAFDGQLISRSHPEQADALLGDGLTTDKSGSEFKLHRDLAGVAKLFAVAPTSISSDLLLRHPTLNPLRRQMSEADRASLDAVIKKSLEAWEAVERKRMLDQHDGLIALDQSGGLVELTADHADPEIKKKVEQTSEAAVKAIIKRFAREGQTIGHDDAVALLKQGALTKYAKQIIPGASAFLQRDGKIFVATTEQLRPIRSSKEEADYMKTLFLQDTLIWFLSHGLTTEDAATKELIELNRLLGF